MKNKIFVFFLLITLCLGEIVPVHATNQTKTSGTTENDKMNVIEISTSEEFLAFAEKCKLDMYSLGKIIELKNDIDISGLEFEGISYFNGIFHGNGYCLIVAGEDILHQFLIGSLGKQAHHRYDHKTCQHAERTGIDGRLQHCREHGLCHHIGKHNDCREQEADPDRCLGDTLPVRAVQERCQERTCQCTPGHAHKLCNEGHIGAILYNGKNDGNQNEDNDQYPHDQQLLFLTKFLDYRAFDEVQRQRGTGCQNQRAERRHGSRQDQNHNHCDQHRRKA